MLIKKIKINYLANEQAIKMVNPASQTGAFCVYV